jgi:hypothetical protein
VRHVAVADQDRRARLNQRLRQAFVSGAEADSRRRLGRGLTAEELERVLWHYPGDVATPQEDSMSRVEVIAAVAGDGWECRVHRPRRPRDAPPRPRVPSRSRSSRSGGV